MANPVLMNGMASPVSVYETVAGTDNATHRVGTRGVLDDRVFYWTKFTGGTAIGPNKLAQQAPPEATHVSESNGPFTAGTRVVDFTPGAVVVAQDQYRGGYIKVQGGTNGIGQIYKLKGHGFKAASTATTFEIDDEVVTTTTGSETASLIHNPFSGVVIQPTTITAPAAGVTLVNFAAVSTASVVTNGYLQTDTTTWTQPRYGWLQTWGIASVLQDTTDIVAGSGVIVGATAGSIGLAVESDIKQRIGVAVEALATNSEYATIWLMIAP